MRLRIYERSLNGVRADLRGLYVPDGDGGFKLDCDIDEVVRGLKSALKRERELNREFKTAGVTPDGLTAVGGMSNVVKRPADIRAGILPRRGTPSTGNGVT
jgi:hypothetical protein